MVEKESRATVPPLVVSISSRGKHKPEIDRVLEGMQKLSTQASARAVLGELELEAFAPLSAQQKSQLEEWKHGYGSAP